MSDLQIESKAAWLHWRRHVWDEKRAPSAAETFLAGRVSGRADAAAQALTEARDEMMDAVDPQVILATPILVSFLKRLSTRAAQYREKGKAQ